MWESYSAKTGESEANGCREKGEKKITIAGNGGVMAESAIRDVIAPKKFKEETELRLIIFPVYQVKSYPKWNYRRMPRNRCCLFLYLLMLIRAKEKELIVLN